MFWISNGFWQCKFHLSMFTISWPPSFFLFRRQIRALVIEFWFLDCIFLISLYSGIKDDIQYSHNNWTSICKQWLRLYNGRNRNTDVYNVAKVYLNIFGYWMQNCHACCHLNKMFIKFTRGQQKDHQQNR